MNLIRLLLAFGFASFYLLPQSSAQWVEYNYFSEDELDEINSPLQIDSEYFSDILTYRLPFAMDARFRREPKIYDVTVGSLNGTRFATQQRVKIDNKLNDSFSFRLVYFEKKDFEEAFQHVIGELQYHFADNWSLAANAELLSEKDGDDLGLALLWQATESHEVRVFATAIDYSFTKRTERNARDLTSPNLFGLVGRWFPERESTYYEYFIKIQTPLQREFFDTSVIYQFRETEVGHRGRLRLSGSDRYLHLEMTYKRKLEGEQNNAPSLPSPRFLWRSDQWNFLLQQESAGWIYGLDSHFRSWDLEGQTVDSRHLLPHVWFKFRDGDQEHFRMGYEMTWSHTEGPGALRTWPDRNREFEHRANLRYSILFNEKAALHLQFTADLDDPSWEGGNGQFQMTF